MALAGSLGATDEGRPRWTDINEDPRIIFCGRKRTLLIKIQTTLAYRFSNCDLLTEQSVLFECIRWHPIQDNP